MQEQTAQICPVLDWISQRVGNRHRFTPLRFPSSYLGQSKIAMATHSFCSSSPTILFPVVSTTTPSPSFLPWTTLADPTGLPAFSYCSPTACSCKSCPSLLKVFQSLPITWKTGLVRLARLPIPFQPHLHSDSSYDKPSSVLSGLLHTPYILHSNPICLSLILFSS